MQLNIRRQLIIFKSQSFGRIFWVDDNDDFKSCPQNIDGTGDFDCDDSVSEWDDWSDVDMNLLLNIYKNELINKVQYANSLTTKEVKSQSKMNTYDEQFYKEIVKDSEFSYGKFNENNYPLHLQQQ